MTGKPEVTARKILSSLFPKGRFGTHAIREIGLFSADLRGRSIFSRPFEAEFSPIWPKRYPWFESSYQVVDYKDFMAVDAVRCELLSVSKIPVTREKYREFFD